MMEITLTCYLANGRDFGWFFSVSGLYVRWAEMRSAVVLFYLKSDPSRCLWYFFTCHIDTQVWCSLGLCHVPASTVL